MASSSQAARIVFVSGLVTFGSGFVAAFTEPHAHFPSPRHVRLFVGAGITFVTLGALADVKPDLAIPGALLVGSTALLTNGGPALDLIGKAGQLSGITKNPYPATRSPASPVSTDMGPTEGIDEGE